jgi:ZIP family zinc transporter
VLISAVAFDLIEEGSEISNGSGGVGAGLFAGCLVFFLGDRLIDRFGSPGDGQASDGEGAGNPLGIVLGSVLDGVPESMVIGLTLLQSGEVGAAYIAAVFLSNVPEGIGATQGLLGSGWSKGHVVLLWSAVALACALSSLAGYSLLNGASVQTIAFVLAFAGGAILTMLASEMMPEAFEFGGPLVGVVTTLGFGVAYALHSFA